MANIDFKKLQLCIANIRQNPPTDPLAQLQAEVLICEAKATIADAEEADVLRLQRKTLPSVEYAVARRGTTWFTFCHGQLIAENRMMTGAYRDAWKHHENPYDFEEMELETLLQAARELLGRHDPLGEASNVLTAGGCTSTVVAGLSASGEAFRVDDKDLAVEVLDLLGVLSQESNDGEAA